MSINQRRQGNETDNTKDKIKNILRKIIKNHLAMNDNYLALLSSSAETVASMN